MKDASEAICTARDEEHFVKFLVKGFIPKLESNPKKGDKVQIVAFARCNENGTMFLEGPFDKIKKLEPEEEAYSDLKPSASPGKVSKVSKRMKKQF